MNGRQALGNAAERLLYEIVGLLLPGGLLAFGVAAALGIDAWAAFWSAASKCPVLTVAALYLLGYPLQAVSPPLTEAIRAVTRWTTARLVQVRRLLMPNWDAQESEFATGPADLWAFACDHWTRRLRLEPGQKLSHSQVQDLSFSVVAGERRQLDRFRAAASATRASAAAVVIIALVLTFQLVAAPRTTPLLPLPGVLVVLVILVVVFYGFVERAGMYEALWDRVLVAQFLASVTTDRSNRGEEDQDD